LALASLFAFAHFSHHLSNALLTPLLPWIRTAFELDYFRAGLLNSSFAVIYGAGQLPMGALADRVGRRFLMAVVALGGATVAAMLIGLSTTYIQLLLALALMGMLGSAYHPLAGSLLSQQVGRQDRGKAFGVHLIGGNGGHLVAPLVGAAIAATMDWRAAFLILPLGALVAAALIWRSVEEPPLAHGAPAGEATGQRGLARLLGPIGPVLVIARPIIPLLALIILIHFVQQSVSSFLPLYLVDKHGVERPVAAAMVALISGAGMIGAPLGGALSDRWGRKPVIILSIVLVGPFVFLITGAPFGVWLIGTVVFLGLARSLQAPVIDSLLADTIPAERRATAFGLYFFLNSEIGGLGVPVVGYIIDTVGLDTGFTSLALLVCGISVLAFLLRDRV
jgi:FSR family fosmidomycin resistance protein-like MFS transporter